jgi:DNA-binding response OmpR family regulator
MAILMLTARTQVEDRVAGLYSGADDYLVKPFSLDELLARVRALMRRDAPEKAGLLTAADLELDPATHTVQRAGMPISLTTKEFALLEYMLRNPNWLITREMAERHVWDYGVASYSNLVDVYIRRLRRKLDDPFEVKLIETVRGFGYRLNKPE